ncbi:MAG: CoA-binding protein [Firmicutes bacterium]|nr:CoA-binding protein [Bacillota bacterium]
MNGYTDREVADFLAGSKTVAVVGLSQDPGKDSYQVASYLQSQGYEIIPVNPNARTILGRPARASLTEISETVDIVVVFRKSDDVAPIIDGAIKIGAKGVWLQLGITSPAAEAKALGAGLFVISDRCIMTQHRRLLARAQM